MHNVTDIVIGRMDAIERQLDKLNNRIDDILGDIVLAHQSLQKIKDAIELNKIDELKLSEINLQLNMAEIDDGSVN